MADAAKASRAARKKAAAKKSAPVATAPLLDAYNGDDFAANGIRVTHMPCLFVPPFLPSPAVLTACDS
jgi:hypothetical protein